MAGEELTPEAEKTLRSYQWPGNVRELRNLMERIVILNPQVRIDARHIPLPGGARRDRSNDGATLPTLEEARKAYEREMEALIRLLILQLKSRNMKIRSQAVRLINQLGIVRDDVLAALLPLLLDKDVSIRYCTDVPSQVLCVLYTVISRASVSFL